jgi:hypothetical protein
MSSARATLSVAPLDAGHATLALSGLFKPKAFSDAEAAALLEGAYRSGIAMMEKALGLV